MKDNIRSSFPSKARRGSSNSATRTSDEQSDDRQTRSTRTNLDFAKPDGIADYPLACSFALAASHSR